MLKRARSCSRSNPWTRATNVRSSGWPLWTTTSIFWTGPIIRSSRVWAGIWPMTWALVTTYPGLPAKNPDPDDFARVWVQRM